MGHSCFRFHSFSETIIPFHCYLIHVSFLVVSTISNVHHYNATSWTISPMSLNYNFQMCFYMHHNSVFKLFISTRCSNFGVIVFHFRSWSGSFSLLAFKLKKCCHLAFSMAHLCAMAIVRGLPMFDQWDDRRAEMPKESKRGGFNLSPAPVHAMQDDLIERMYFCPPPHISNISHNDDNWTRVFQWQQQPQQQKHGITILIITIRISTIVTITTSSSIIIYHYFSWTAYQQYSSE